MFGTLLPEMSLDLGFVTLNAFWLGSLAVVLLTFALPFLPLAPWLGFVPLPPLFLLTLLGVVAAYLVATQFIKAWFFARQKPAHAQ